MANILELEVEERLRLVHEIWDSIAEHPDAIPLTDGERAELHRRLDEYQRNPQSGSSWDEVKARIATSVNHTLVIRPQAEADVPLPDGIPTVMRWGPGSDPGTNSVLQPLP